MKKVLVSLTLAVAVTGCMSYPPSVPEGYVGPVATIEDSSILYGIRRVDVFYVSHIDGRRIYDSLTYTRETSSWLTPMTGDVLDREVTAEEHIVTIGARAVYSPGIMEWYSPVYEVLGDVAFQPEPDKRYVVTGELGEGYSAVWIEDKNTKEIVTKKIVMRN